MAPKWLKVPQKSIFLDPIGGPIGAYSAPQTPSCWLLATLDCNALRALHNALHMLSILCLRYFPAFSFHESCIPDLKLYIILDIYCEYQ